MDVSLITVALIKEMKLDLSCHRLELKAQKVALHPQRNINPGLEYLTHMVVPMFFSTDLELIIKHYIGEA